MVSNKTIELCEGIIDSIGVQMSNHRCFKDMKRDAWHFCNALHLLGKIMSFEIHEYSNSPKGMYPGNNYQSDGIEVRIQYSLFAEQLAIRIDKNGVVNQALILTLISWKVLYKFDLSNVSLKPLVMIDSGVDMNLNVVD